MAPAVLLSLAAVLAGCVQVSDAGPAAVPAAGSAWSGNEEAPRLMLTLGDPATSGLAAWPGDFHTDATPFDLDGDLVDELVVHSTDTRVYVFDARSGRVRATIPTALPPAWHVDQVLNRVAAGVLVPGETPSLVIANSAGQLAAWQVASGDPRDGREDGMRLEKRWARSMDECRAWPGMDARPVLADLDGDGTLEILVQTEEIGLYAIRADGSTLWRKCWGGGNASPVAADLDGDGRLEAIFASDAGLVAVLDGATGAPLWTFDTRSLGIHPASIVVSPTVAELDGRPPRELVYVAREARSEDAATFGDNHMAMVAIRRNLTTWSGELAWMRQPSWSNPMSYTHLAAYDLDGDGSDDLFGMDWNTIGHRPGDWKRLGPARAFRLDADGEDVWVREIDAWWSNKDVVLSDSDGDGAIDLLVNGPSGASDGLWRLDAATGGAQGFLALDAWTMTRGPLLLDTDRDGRLELAVSVVSPDGPARSAVLLYELSPQAGRPAWTGAP